MGNTKFALFGHLDPLATGIFQLLTIQAPRLRSPRLATAGSSRRSKSLVRDSAIFGRCPLGCHRRCDDAYGARWRVLVSRAYTSRRHWTSSPFGKTAVGFTLCALGHFRSDSRHVE